jgi:hypothetical protein
MNSSKIGTPFVRVQMRFLQTPPFQKPSYPLMFLIAFGSFGVAMVIKYQLLGADLDKNGVWYWRAMAAAILTTILIIGKAASQLVRHD